MPEIKKIVLKNGKIRYRAVVDAGADPITRKRRQITITEDRKTQVKDEIARIRTEVANGTFVAPSKITLGEWITTWMALERDEWEETTYLNYLSIMGELSAYLGAIPLQDLREEHIEDWRDHRLTEVRTGTVDRQLSKLRACLRVAIRRHMLQHNPAEYVTVSRKARRNDKVNNPEEQPWSVEEISQFLVHIRNHRLFAPLLLGLMGLGPAEVCGLRWSDIDLEAGTLRVEITRTLAAGAVVEKETKVPSRDRTLPLPQSVCTALKDFQRKQRMEELACEPGVYSKSGYMLVNEIGVPSRTAYLRNDARALMAEADVRVVRWYLARSACLTYLADKGVRDTILAKWAGHSKVSTTKRYYIKPNTAALEVASDALEGLFTGDA